MINYFWRYVFLYSTEFSKKHLQFLESEEISEKLQNRPKVLLPDKPKETQEGGDLFHWVAPQMPRTVGAALNLSQEPGTLSGSPHMDGKDPHFERPPVISEGAH